MTGSARGLGRAMAEEALKRGGKVTISDVLVKEAEETEAKFAKAYGSDKVTFVRCDVRSEDEVKALWDQTVAYFGAPVDVMVNNAGVNQIGGWKRCMDINIVSKIGFDPFSLYILLNIFQIGVMNGTYLAYDKMSKSNGGNGGIIINTASMAGIVGSANPAPLSYFVSKHAVVALTKSLGHPKVYAKSGIRLSCICPSFTDTDIVTPFTDEIKNEYKTVVMPVSRVADGFVSLMKADEKSSNGKALAIVPEAPDFYWPQHDYVWLAWMGLGATLFKKVMPNAPIFETKHQMVWMILTFLAFHVLLNVLCCILC